MKKNMLLVLIICTILILSGCASASEPDEAPDTNTLPPVQSDDTPPPAPPSDTLPPVRVDDIAQLIRLDEAAPLISTGSGQSMSATAVARGANDFAFRLSAALLEDIGYENFVVSPYSVWMPLAALVNATREPLRPALIEVLGAAGISPDNINRAASRMLFDLTNERARRENWASRGGSEESPLHIANAIFVDYNWPLRKEFAQTFADFYRGSAMNVDFSSKAAVDAVNQWASDNTSGLINEVVQEFDPDAVAAIVNAIYFSGSWSRAFDPDNTERGTFYSPAYTREVYFMQQSGVFTYFEDEHIQAVDLAFTGDSGMMIILPKDGDAVGFMSTMTNECFNQIQRSSVIGDGRLELPRFSIENTLGNLKDALIAMGIPLFDEMAAPLTGGLIYDDGLPVWLGDAIQVAMIEVDEEGATAAAVTAMMVHVRSGLLPQTTFEMICNTPFAFILYSNIRDGGRQILFMGVVNQP